MDKIQYDKLSNKSNKSYQDYIDLLTALNTETELNWIDDLVKDLKGELV